MKPTVLLRIASVVALVQFAAHTLLFVFSSPKHGPEESAVVEAMKAHRFNFIGSMRSYWDFYFGYGLEAAFFCLLEAVLFWQLGTIAKTAPLVIRPIVVLFHHPSCSGHLDRCMPRVRVHDGSRLTSA